MPIVEIELPIKGDLDKINKQLLEQGFEVFYKVLTISDYYLPINDNDMEHSTLKERCKRIRYIEPVEKFYTPQHVYKKFIKNYEINECKKEEQKLIDSGYKKIYTDEKLDFVYKYKNEDKMYFQIQDIKDNCLIIAYDNEKYYNYPPKEQKDLLIKDVLRFGIELLNTDNIDRFKGVGNILTIEEIINKMNKVLENL